MDPDDPKTYHSGTFDLSHSPKNSPRLSIFGYIREYLSSQKDVKFLIPIVLFLILGLNLIKIYSTTGTEIKNKEEKKDFLEGQELPPPPHEENKEIPKPSVEI